MHTYSSAWPKDPVRRLPAALYDALTNGRETDIRYVNSEGLEARRTIRPVACFAVGRTTYLRAFCNIAKELRTFRVDRIVECSGLARQCCSDVDGRATSQPKQTASDK
jgi:predicted DNA-binding transcriptional regulator YafY